MLIQFHVLQNHAPSNLNRDETGAPKSAVFGNVERGRISSQALKRSIRRSTIFSDAFAERGLLANRTNRLPGLIDDALAKLGADEDSRANIIKRIPEIGKREGKAKSDDEDDGVLKTKILVFLTQQESEQIAQKLHDLYIEKGEKGFAKLKIAEVEKAMANDMPRSVDVAMFGRMTTSAAFEDVTAAVQVAHAISTNALTPQFDYFTAVDDLSGESGAGMIGNVEFNSSTYYKYFSVHWEKLVDNLGGDSEIALEAVKALLEAIALVSPSGKQNSFAAHNLPDFVLVEVGARNVPISYANAFTKPVRPKRDQSLMDRSAEALADYVAKLRDAYGVESAQAVLSLTDSTVDSGRKSCVSPRFTAMA